MLKNNVVAITGGAGLIGTAFSKAIIKNGGKVIIGDISVDRGQKLQDELGVDNALFIEVNTSNTDSIDNFLETGSNHFGKIDSAIHCSYPRSEQWGTKFEDLEAGELKNDLFDLPNTSMVFGDAKKVLNDLIGELKDLGVGEK